MNRNLVLAVAAAATVTGFWGTAAFADDIWNGSFGDGQWKTAQNWDNFSVPGSLANELANLQGSFGGDLTVNIDGAASPTLVPLGTLRLGTQDDAYITTITGTNGATFTANNIISSGSTEGGSNIIGLNYVLPTGNLVLSKDALHASGYALTFNGSVSNPNVTGRTIQNTIPNADITAPTAAVTYNGEIVLSTAAAASAFNTTFRTDAGAYTVLNGAITGFSNAVVLYSGAGVTEINGANTYAGNTTLGANSPNVSGTIKVGVDAVMSGATIVSSPFGKGTVTFTGGAAPQFVEANGAARTIVNNIVLGRYGGVTGANSQTWSGTITQSNSRGIVNNLASGATLTLSGPVFTDQTTGGTGRTLEIQGTGNTIFTGVIEDHNGALALDTSGAIKHGGSGTVWIKSDSTYHGTTQVVAGGKLYVGDGATGGSLVNSFTVSGGSTGTGQFGFDRTDSFTSNQTLNGAVGFSKINANTITLADTNFNTGNNTIVAGKLLVNGGSLASSTVTGATVAIGSAGAFGTQTVRVISDLPAGFAATLKVGQSVFPTAGAYGGSYITAIDVGANTVTVYNAGPAGTGGNNGTGVALAAGGQNQNLTFGNGFGLGGNTTVQGGGTLGGTGTLGGNVTVQNNGTLAPGASIESLDVAGNVQFNPGSHWEIEFDGAGAGSIDLLAITGGFTVFGGNLDFAQLGDLADDAVYVFATYGVAPTFSGAFTENNVPAGYVVNYAYNGNSFALVSTVPEPATLGLIGLGSLVALRRRRR